MEKRCSSQASGTALCSHSASLRRYSTLWPLGPSLDTTCSCQVEFLKIENGKPVLQWQWRLQVQANRVQSLVRQRRREQGREQWQRSLLLATDGREWSAGCIHPMSSPWKKEMKMEIVKFSPVVQIVECLLPLQLHCNSMGFIFLVLFKAKLKSWSSNSWKVHLNQSCHSTRLSRSPPVSLVTLPHPATSSTVRNGKMRNFTCVQNL